MNLMKAAFPPMFYLNRRQKAHSSLFINWACFYLYDFVTELIKVPNRAEQGSEKSCILLVFIQQRCSLFC